MYSLRSSGVVFIGQGVYFTAVEDCATTRRLIRNTKTIRTAVAAFFSFILLGK
jgi:hypothetical protein